jgi:hypothetical protein
MYTRELGRKQQGTTGKTRMKYAAVHPDHFSKMSAHLAKVVFELDSVMEQIHHLAKLIEKEQELLVHMRDIKDGTALTTYRSALQYLKTPLESDEFKLMDGLASTRFGKGNHEFNRIQCVSWGYIQ